MEGFNPELLKLIISQGVFAVLFVWLLFDSRKESKTREEKLMIQIEKSNDAHGQIIMAIENLTNKLEGR
ncbi:MAG TPA: BhlA/UviB family holin-like peptide [Syntrophomonadaceae bacterium]|nr:BhlA/UviB family holin-like peptide [Syntrophomonadaceae bacterium]